MKFNHFEMIRMAILRNVDYNKVFAIWRVPSPWQPISKKVLYYKCIYYINRYKIIIRFAEIYILYRVMDHEWVPVKEV